MIGVHAFFEGMKLEAVDPMAPFVISPATVVKVQGFFNLSYEDSIQLLLLFLNAEEILINCLS